MKKLEFLNAQHIRNKFTYFEDPVDKKNCVTEFRAILLENLDDKFHSKIRQTSDTKLVKIMDMMKPRIHYFKDLKNHTYFFEEPIYSDARA